MKKRWLTGLVILELLLFGSGILLVAKPIHHFLVRETLRQWSGYQWQQSLNRNNPGFRPDEPAAWLKIPEAGIDTMVLASGNRENLLKFPGFANGFGLNDDNASIAKWISSK